MLTETVFSYYILPKGWKFRLKKHAVVWKYIIRGVGAFFGFKLNTLCLCLIVHYSIFLLNRLN